MQTKQLVTQGFLALCLAAPFSAFGDDNAEPLGKVEFDFRSRIQMVRLAMYEGGQEPTPDGIGKFTEGTRGSVLAKEGPKPFGFVIGKDGAPKAYMLQRKEAERFIGAGRYQYVRSNGTSKWYDVLAGDEVDPKSAKLEKITVHSSSGQTNEITLVEFISSYQKALDAAYKGDEGYSQRVSKLSDESERLAVALAYHKERKK